MTMVLASPSSPRSAVCQTAVEKIIERGPGMPGPYTAPLGGTLWVPRPRAACPHGRGDNQAVGAIISWQIAEAPSPP